MISSADAVATEAGVAILGLSCGGGVLAWG